MEGANIRIDIWRMSAGTDDYVGGASITGTVAYTSLPARMQGNPDEQFLAAQGLETLRTYTFTVARGNLDIRERDEIEVVFPPTYPYINKRFRITSVRYSDFNDPRRYMMLEAQRSVVAHTEQ